MERQPRDLARREDEAARRGSEEAMLQQEVTDGDIAEIARASRVAGKLERGKTLSDIRSRAVEKHAAEYPDSEKQFAHIMEELEREVVRGQIIKEKRRSDGRSLTDVRSIVCEVGVLPRTHGSALFTRGETQSLVVTTLGTAQDEQRIDELIGESFKSFMLHYNFPPFSVGETGRFSGPGRREIGHGMLAERAIQPIIPADEQFLQGGMAAVTGPGQ